MSQISQFSLSLSQPLTNPHCPSPQTVRIADGLLCISCVEGSKYQLTTFTYIYRLLSTHYDVSLYQNNKTYYNPSVIKNKRQYYQYITTVLMNHNQLAVTALPVSVQLIVPSLVSSEMYVKYVYYLFLRFFTFRIFSSTDHNRPLTVSCVM
jgi:hypothetical protein